MTRGARTPGRSAHPLAGALDRLLARERGDDHGAGVGGRDDNRPGATHPHDPAAPRTVTSAVPLEMPAASAEQAASAASRRMLVIAALGGDGGAAALRTVARWALAVGRRPAALDLSRGESIGESVLPGEPGAALPWAGLPGGPERLRAEPPEVVAALIERLRRHEAASDLLLIVAPAKGRMLLMRAALLSGGLVLPLDDSADALEEACRLSREVVENFVDLELWPLAGDPLALRRYLAAMRGIPGARPRPLEAEMGRGPAIIDRLRDAPAEGFLTALLAPDEVPPPPHLLQTGLLRL